MTPTIGRIVHYTLSDQDASAIQQRRQDPHEHRRGNPVQGGQVYPALIVRTWGDVPGSAVQLQVFLDGDDTYWATSRTEGEGPNTWAWPTRKES